jgi:hypothetical protein
MVNISNTNHLPSVTNSKIQPVPIEGLSLSLILTVSTQNAAKISQSITFNLLVPEFGI